MAKNLPHLGRHSQKKQKTKNFISLQTQRLAESSQSPGELWSCKVAWN